MFSALALAGAKSGDTRCSAHSNPSRPGVKGLFWILVELVRKDRRGRVKLAVPAEVRHVGRPNDVLNHAPLAADFVQQRHHAVVKRSGLLSLGVWRVSIIDLPAVRPAGSA